MKQSFRTTAVVVAALVAGASLSYAQDGTIKGKITLKGTPPGETEIKMADADPQCAKLHSTPVKTRRYVVGSNGELANVFVYVKEGLAGKKFEAPKTSVLLDQQGCIYSPYVFGIQVGQTLDIANSDDTAHNVHIMPEKNPDKNIGQPVKGMRSKHKFDQEEVMVKFKCDIHPWMFAYVGVLSHPFFAVTDESGSFKISGLPPGEYTIEAWHLKAGTKTAKLKVDAGGTATADLSFDAK